LITLIYLAKKKRPQLFIKILALFPYDTSIKIVVFKELPFSQRKIVQFLQVNIQAVAIYEANGHQL
jgi:hypothetical protein